MFDAVQEQLKENQKRCRQRKSAARHLLQGLVVCKCCRYAFYGRADPKNKSYVYYRCTGTEAARFGGHRVCDNKPVHKDALDQAVWNDVRSLLADPARIEEELNRRLDRNDDAEKQSGKKLQLQADKINRGIDRRATRNTAGSGGFAGKSRVLCLYRIGRGSNCHVLVFDAVNWDNPRARASGAVSAAKGTFS